MKTKIQLHKKCIEVLETIDRATKQREHYQERYHKTKNNYKRYLLVSRTQVYNRYIRILNYKYNELTKA